MINSIIEDSKVIGSASMAVLIGYTEIFNHIITLCISLCTLIYVANRAYQSIAAYKKSKKKRGRRK